MATYAIGDVQGCFAPLQALLKKIRFNADRDRLMFTGDLVNRGADNVRVLRFIRDLGENAVTVLGNHDLHMLAVAHGHRQYYGDGDTFEDVLQAPDRDALLEWLAARPFLREEAGYCLVHAGLPPPWDLPLARRCAAEATQALGGDHRAEFLGQMYGNHPDQWREDLQGWDRLRFIVNAFTRMRFCAADGRLDFTHKLAPGTQPPDLQPWFRAPRRRNIDAKIIFGHWAALGRYSGEGVYGLDSGCVWGRHLTAMRLGAEADFAVDC